MLDLCSPAVEFLSERYRHSVHEMRASRLHDVARLADLGLENLGQMPQRGQQLGLYRDRCTDVHTGRNHVITALAHVHVIIRMHVGARCGCRQVSDNLIGVHVRTGTRPGLKNVDRKLRVVVAVGYRLRRLLDSNRNIAFEQTQFRVGARRGPLHETQRRDELARHREPRNRKIIDRALRLRAPERIVRNLQFAHAVLFDAVSLVTHCSSCSVRRFCTVW